jgi:hypothetical protein
MTVCAVTLLNIYTPQRTRTQAKVSHTGGLLDAGVWINTIRTVVIGAIPGGWTCPTRVRKGVAVVHGVSYRLASKRLSWDRKMHPDTCSDDGSEGQTPQVGLRTFIGG